MGRGKIGRTKGGPSLYLDPLLQLLDHVRLEVILAIHLSDLLPSRLPLPLPTDPHLASLRRLGGDCAVPAQNIARWRRTPTTQLRFNMLLEFWRESAKNSLLEMLIGT